jgi:hypothetical protein
MKNEFEFPVICGRLKRLTTGWKNIDLEKWLFQCFFLAGGTTLHSIALSYKDMAVIS